MTVPEPNNADLATSTNLHRLRVHKSNKKHQSWSNVLQSLDGVAVAVGQEMLLLFQIPADFLHTCFKEKETFSILRLTIHILLVNFRINLAPVVDLMIHRGRWLDLLVSCIS